MDGFPVASQSVFFTIEDNSTVTIGFFDDKHGYPYFFKGLIDEVSIWDTALTQDKIQSYMNLELTGAEAGLIGYWSFNEGSGMTAFDQSHSNNDGTLQNGTQWINSDVPLWNWLSVDPIFGVCPADSSVNISINFNINDFMTGDYQGGIKITTNDPDNPELVIPVHLKVTPLGIADQIAGNIPKKFVLSQNYPNPFNPTTTISYQIQKTCEVELSIYNLLGQKVATLVSEQQPAGVYQVQWDANDFASGIYYYKLWAGDFQQV